MDELETRKGLTDALRYLVETYPRDIWESHRNFDELTRFWLERHMMFRQLLERLSGETRAYLDGKRDAQDFGRNSSRLTGFLLNQLHGHHQIEDIYYFPKLAGLEPRLQAGFELLDADHHALDGHIHAMADDTNALLRALEAGGGHDAAGRVDARLGRFSGFLDRHLVDEEELVIPTILHHAPQL